MAPVAIEVAAGPSMHDLQPIAANLDSKPFDIDSDIFRGRLVVRIRNYKRPSDGQVEEDTETAFFKQHPDMHWSIEMQGRFMDGDHSLNDLTFGVAFDRSIKEHLPMATGLALKLVRLVDPTIEDELETEDPWMMAPMCANLNRLTFSPLADGELPAWKPDVQEDVTPLVQDHPEFRGDYHARRKHFFKTANRQAVLPANMAFQGNFVNPYLQFQDGVALQLPKGFSLDLLKYWSKSDQPPVYFVLRHRTQDKEYLAVRFQLAPS